MNPEEGVHRLLGNASFRGYTNFRCLNGFPSFRRANYIFVSQRNINKEDITIDSFIPTYLDGSVYYIGELKPSVDTPIQLRLYRELPNINYTIHSHCYVDGGKFTTKAIPCGALQEVDEVLSLIEDKEQDKYVINLLGHGSIIMGNKVEDIENMNYRARSLPEKMKIL